MLWTLQNLILFIFSFGLTYSKRLQNGEEKRYKHKTNKKGKKELTQSVFTCSQYDMNSFQALPNSINSKTMRFIGSLLRIFIDGHFIRTSFVAQLFSEKVLHFTNVTYYNLCGLGYFTNCTEVFGYYDNNIVLSFSILIKAWHITLF